MNYFFVSDVICKYDLSVFPRATFLQLKNEDEITINYILNFMDGQSLCVLKPYRY